MKSLNGQNNNFVFVSFNKLWRYFTLRRSTKEDIKWFLFTLFPFLFKKWVIYLNWKSARVYCNTELTIFKRDFWKRKFHQSYPIPLPKPANEKPGKETFDQSLAVVVHVFYTDIFNEILHHLSKAENCRMHLYVTGETNHMEKVEPSLLKNFTSVEFHPCPNHGRDILPFLKVLPKVFDDGHEIVLKLHTKGSNHLNRKVHWRNDLFSKLIGVDKVTNLMKILDRNQQIGMIGPSENILPMKNYYGSNAKIVNELSNDLGVRDELLTDLNFVAGSMFYARKEALLPLLKLNLSDENFEKEKGQTDGTMAHAVERLFTVGLIVAGLHLADTDYDEKNPILMVNKNHYFSQ